jgi:hypothetical protein
MKTQRWLNICAIAAFAVCCGLVCALAQQTQNLSTESGGLFGAQAGLVGR